MGALIFPTPSCPLSPPPAHLADGLRLHTNTEVRGCPHVAISMDPRSVLRAHGVCQRSQDDPYARRVRACAYKTSDLKCTDKSRRAVLKVLMRWRWLNQYQYTALSSFHVAVRTHSLGPQTPTNILDLPAPNLAQPTPCIRLARQTRGRTGGGADEREAVCSGW